MVNYILFKYKEAVWNICTVKAKFKISCLNFTLNIQWNHQPKGQIFGVFICLYMTEMFKKLIITVFPRTCLPSFFVNLFEQESLLYIYPMIIQINFAFNCFNFTPIFFSNQLSLKINSWSPIFFICRWR